MVTDRACDDVFAFNVSIRLYNDNNNNTVYNVYCIIIHYTLYRDTLYSIQYTPGIFSASDPITSLSPSKLLHNTPILLLVISLQSSTDTCKDVAFDENLQRYKEEYDSE